MARSRGDMASPTHLVLLAALSLAVLCRAGPLGPLPNVTSADLGFKEGSCALGDVVYMPGDEFPGTSPCERCVCAGGGVRCDRITCEPRPGCKAVHRPDHCCPTYQCECEQEGRVYGNGEKLVDPLDPCRVCYCQGGEVVCRRIACFVRDDCTPRLVPGRCCPEYDNCPLRGVTSLPGVSTSMPSVTTAQKVESPPAPPKENIKQEITIKEITPVSEIPVITDVKIKEILPVPTDVAEYSSSKSPLIPREATTEKNIKESETRTESPSVIEIHPSQSTVVSSPQTIVTETKETDLPPSKISLATQDTIHSAIYPSNVPIVATMGLPPVTVPPTPAATTKAPMIEEEDTFDHDPAFPPLPDDLAVLRNREDEIVPEVVADGDHLPSHDIMTSTIIPPTETPTVPDVKQHKVTAPENKEPLTTPKDLPDTTIITTSEKAKTIVDISTFRIETTTTEVPKLKESPNLNLRSAIITETLDSSSLTPYEILRGNEEVTTVNSGTTTPASEITIIQEKTTTKADEFTTVKYTTTDAPTTVTPVNAYTATTEGHYSTSNPTDTTTVNSIKEQEPTTTTTSKSSVTTEITSKTEISSLPVETSDQNPPAIPEYTTNGKIISSTADTLETTKIPLTSSEVITVSRGLDTTTNFDNVETTEFIVPSYGSSETATDAVEIIKISAEPEKSASIIEPPQDKKNTVMTDFITLVSDVASIGDQTSQKNDQAATTTSRISNSEELIPVNFGYSKNKNKNYNMNSITEIPLKNKNKQRIEIEDDESESVTDSPPPNDKVEPTTRRPIIDNVTDDMAANKTDKTDIEIIHQPYVPTVNRRPSKVVKKSGEKHLSEDSATSKSGADETTVTDVSSSTIRDIPSTTAPLTVTFSTTARVTTDFSIFTPSTTTPPATDPTTIVPSTISPPTTAPPTTTPTTEALPITAYTTSVPSTTLPPTTAPSTRVPPTVPPSTTPPPTSVPTSAVSTNTAASTETPPTTQ